MALPAVTIFEPAKHVHLLPQFVQIHADCILRDGAILRYIPDDNGSLDLARMLKSYQEMAGEITAGTRFVVLQSTNEEVTEIMGFVSLHMPIRQTGPFRGYVEKLMVSPLHRHKGVARRLMMKLEDVAIEHGRGLLMLNTATGSGGAAEFYPKLGYKQIGLIPRFGIHPLTKELTDEMFFYKDLR